MSININSEASCRKAYLNYHCYGNTMGISAREMGEITDAWKDRLSSWQSTVSNDENEYEFDDSEFSASKDKGKESAKEASGHDGGKGKMIARGVGDAAVAGFGTAANVIGADIAGKTISSSIGKTLGKAAGKTGKDKAGNGGWMIAAPLALATGTAYMAKKPNKTEKEACDALQNEMGNAQGALTEAQNEMATMSEELIELSDEATAYNEEANEEIEEQKTEYDMYMQTFQALKEKAESGEPLTEEEKALYKELAGKLTEAGILIAEKSEETTDSVSEIYDDMGTYQEGYDYAAETMGEVEGLTDFAESFDSATQTMCYVEAGVQTLNAASGGKAAFSAGKFAASGGFTTAWAWGFAAAGAAGAAMSIKGTAQQFKWAGEVGSEIEIRKATQDLNTDTNDIYTEEIDGYDGMMTGVEDLELEIPEDIEAPEDTEVPASTGDKAGLPEETPDPLVPDKKEEEEDGKGAQ